MVSRILRLKGYPVYDCDVEAKRIMAESPGIKRRISEEISSEVTDGIRIPDRVKLAEIVFNDENARLLLNEIVHEAVREDVLKKAAQYPVLWVEAAILAESGLADLCERIWKVETPRDVRIENIIRRDRCTPLQAQSRIKAQQKEERLLSQYADKIEVIVNDSENSILQQIETLLKE